MNELKKINLRFIKSKLRRFWKKSNFIALEKKNMIKSNLFLKRRGKMVRIFFSAFLLIYMVFLSSCGMSTEASNSSNNNAAAQMSAQG